MSIRPRSLACSTMLGVAVLASPAHALWPHDPSSNLPVCTATTEQLGPVMIADGTGGLLAAWYDVRNGANFQVFAQHVLAGGTLDPRWPVQGLPVCAAAGDHYDPKIVTDGNGGLLVSWTDTRNPSQTGIFVQHVLNGGTLDPAWPAAGRAVSSVSAGQTNSTIAIDGTGGAIVSWQEPRVASNSDIFAQRIAATGAISPGWPATGLVVCNDASLQSIPVAVGDGAGNAIVGWIDYRNNSFAHAYLQRVLAAGTVDPAWPANGQFVYTSANIFFIVDTLALVSDAAGGAFFTFRHLESYPNTALETGRISSTGSFDPTKVARIPALEIATSSDEAGGMWLAGQEGNALDVEHFLPNGTSTYNNTTVGTGGVHPAITSDGSGGSFVAWQDAGFIKGRHLLANCTIDPGWGSSPVVLCNAPTSLGRVLGVVPDRAIFGGFETMWLDHRGLDGDLYAERAFASGGVGGPEAVILSVKDVPGDQGGHIRVRWQASFLDTLPTLPVASYGVWRQVQRGAVVAARARGSRVIEAAEPAPAAEPGTYRITQVGAQSWYWEGAGTVLARGQADNSYVPDTFADSSGSGVPRAVFMVETQLVQRPFFFDSAPDSGYSVDNLAPAPPAGFTGVYAPNLASLHWARNTETDLAGYRLYRGVTAGFVPGALSLLASPPDTGYADATSGEYFYKLTAVDVHGNESPAVAVSPSTSADVGSGAAELSLARPFPAIASGSTILSWSLDASTRVVLDIADLAGRRVRRLENGLVAAGRHQSAWDLRDESRSRVPPGVYFVRLTAHGDDRVRRVVVMP